MTTEANKVRGHSSCTFVSISRILHTPSSLLIALALEISTRTTYCDNNSYALGYLGEEFLVTIVTNRSATGMYPCSVRV